MTIEIDRKSGFCGGVIRAITTAERYLEEHGGKMYSLGSIVHNERELKRLEGRGLHTIEKEGLEKCAPTAGDVILIRAHGEPPEVYRKIRDCGFRLVDCTCPVVLNLQKSIREAYDALEGRGCIVIFGKVGHPEVLGLVGQVDGDAVVVENSEQLSKALSSGRIDCSRDIELFSQTTMSPPDYAALKAELEKMMCGGAELRAHDTICSQVAGRHRELSRFAAEHDVVIFVSGSHSSNGKVLTDLCRSVNSRTYNVSSPKELRPEWFRPEDSVGVSGATSTPLWLLEEVAGALENLQ